MRRSLFLLIASALALACSDTTTAPEQPTLSVTEASTIATTASNVTTVPPSKKCSDNATAIQLALNNAQPGDVVFLTDGDASTVDTYCVDEGIVVLNGFNGTLKGEGMDQTIIEAVPRPGNKPFLFVFDSDYIPGTYGIWPTVLHFEFPVDVTVTDLTFTEMDPGHPGTYFQFIAIWGGNHTAVFENLAFRGNPPSPEWLVGIHAMGGSQSGVLDGKGTVLIRNVEANDVGDGIDPMWYGDGSTFTIEDVRTTRAGFGVWGQGLSSGLQITGSTFNESARDAVFLRRTRNASITGNTFTNSGQTGIRLIYAWNAIVSENTIRNQHFGVFWHSGIALFSRTQNSVVTHNSFENLSGDGGQAIFLWGPSASVSGNTVDRNAFALSGLPGWTAGTPSGPGAIHLGAGASDNEVFEPEFLVGNGKGLCEMVWDETDDESTSQYDGENKIHGWQPCELIPGRGFGAEGSEAEPGLLRRRF